MHSENQLSLKITIITNEVYDHEVNQAYQTTACLE